MRPYSGEDSEGIYAWIVYLNISTSSLYVNIYIDNFLHRVYRYIYKIIIDVYM
jgi:hypothetical protein